MGDLIRRCARLTYETPRYVYMAYAALPAAGAWTALPALYELSFNGIREVTAWCTYARAAGVAGGQPGLRIVFGDTWSVYPGNPTTGEGGNDIVIDRTLSVAQPFDNQSFYEQTLYGPIPQSNTAITFCLSVRVPRGAVGMWIASAEIGTPNNPGSLGIVLAGGS